MEYCYLIPQQALASKNQILPDLMPLSNEDQLLEFMMPNVHILAYFILPYAMHRKITRIFFISPSHRKFLLPSFGFIVLTILY